MSIASHALEAAHLIDRLERLSRTGEPAADLNAAQWEALRYIARANRFSRTPAALADYLGSTRGTVSQTLIALESKGFIERRPSLRDKRSVSLGLTGKGEAALESDPLLVLARDIQAAAEDAAETLVQVLRATLLAMIRRNQGRAFGVCRTCVHFRKNALPSSEGPHRCALLDEPLSEADSGLICVEQEAAAG